MNESTKQFNADLQKRFADALANLKIGEFVEKTKADDNAVSFRVIISTADEDRQGDELDQSKWKLDNYKANPVVLWAHDYSEPPIAICTAIALQGGKLVAEGKFAPAELNPFAAQIAGLYREGYINTTSVGYIMHEDGALELLEFSFVPVPANPFALSLREMKRLNLNVPELIMKGMTFKAKTQQVGDKCELDDGTPGVLAEDSDNPGAMVCVPERNKSNDNGTMNDDLIKNLKAEHGRHGEAVGKAIDEFGEKCMKCEKAGEISEFEKAIDEYTEKMEGEQADHLEKCMKAIDDNYELQDQKKAIDEFKSDMQAEHLEHVKACDKAIDEFKSAFPQDGEGEDKQKAIDEFTKSMGSELSRHEKAQMGMCAEEGEAEEKSEETPPEEEQIETKSGRAISSANAEKIKAVIKAFEDHHDQFVADHQKATETVIASLKDLMGQQEDEGEETKPAKTGASPKPRSSTSGAVKQGDESLSAFEAYMFSQRLVRQVKTAAEDALRQINKGLKEVRTQGR